MYRSTQKKKLTGAVCFPSFLQDSSLFFAQFWPGFPLSFGSGSLIQGSKFSHFTSQKNQDSHMGGILFIKKKRNRIKKSSKQLVPVFFHGSFFWNPIASPLFMPSTTTERLPPYLIRHHNQSMVCFHLWPKSDSMLVGILGGCLMVFVEIPKQRPKQWCQSLADLMEGTKKTLAQKWNRTLPLPWVAPLGCSLFKL